MGLSATEQPRGDIGRWLAAGALIVLMALGSLALWTVVPLAWIWFAAAVGGTYYLTYLVALFGAPVTMIGLATGLYRIQGLYARLSGASYETPQRPAWLKSVRGESHRRPATLLDVFLIVSAVLAVAALIAWYFGVADGINPSGPLAPGDEHGS